MNLLEGLWVNLCFKLFFFVVVGFYGLLIIINNVEIFCVVMYIFKYGVDWYVGMGIEKFKGMKFFQIFGFVVWFGVYELLFGMLFCEFIYDWVGGFIEDIKVIIFGGIFC